MKRVLKQIISLVLPVTALILVPYFIEKDITVKHLPVLLPGVAVMIIGLFIIGMTVVSMIKIGKGTLAPWSPTRHLVISGLYRYVRNPMILGVLTVLTGESIAILSYRILIWAVLFFVINNIWFMIYEEPDLEKKFGDEYRKYKKNVPRWIPRLKPYKT